MDLKKVLESSNDVASKISAINETRDKLASLDEKEKRVEGIREIIDNGAVPLLPKLIKSKALAKAILDLLQFLVQGKSKEVNTVVSKALLSCLYEYISLGNKHVNAEFIEPSVRVLEAICSTCIDNRDSAFLKDMLMQAGSHVHFTQKIAATFLERAILLWIAKFKFKPEVVVQVFARIGKQCNSVYYDDTPTNCISPDILFCKDRKALLWTFRENLLPCMIGFLSINRGNHIEMMLDVLNWFAEFYPKAVLEACAPEPIGGDLNTALMNMLTFYKSTIIISVLNLLSEFVWAGYATSVAKAGWLPFLVKITGLPAMYVVEASCRGDRGDSTETYAVNESVRTQIHTRACHLIAEIILKSLRTRPQLITPAVIEMTIRPLCGYLQHESNANAPLHGVSYKTRKRQLTDYANDDNNENLELLFRDDYTNIMNCGRRDNRISSPLLALIAIMILRDYDKREFIPVQEDVWLNILRERGMNGADVFARSSRWDVRNRAEIFKLQLESLMNSQKQAGEKSESEFERAELETLE